MILFFACSLSVRHTGDHLLQGCPLPSTLLQESYVWEMILKLTSILKLSFLSGYLTAAIVLTTAITLALVLSPENPWPGVAKFFGVSFFSGLFCGQIKFNFLQIDTHF